MKYRTNATGDKALATALKVLSRRYPALAGKKGEDPEIRFVGGGAPDVCAVSREGGGYVVSYGRRNMALRMAGNLLSGIVPERAEECPFATLGVMIDCSRNAVKTVDWLKGCLDRLALLGYDMAMLYTEDTYRIEGEPLFGFMRGAYSPGEIRQIDDHAASLGIELVPCIETLAHLEQIFKWGGYADIRDCGGIVLEGEEKTYALVRKMVAFWAGCVRSRRIHLGMDEAFGLGTGEHERRFGKQPPFEIVNRHLKRCCAICGEFGMRPMIWSDMYFRIGSANGDYYDPGSQPPERVVRDIPKGLDLVYWDYYHDDRGFYETFIDKHRALGGEPLMGSGVWTWNLFWYGHRNTRTTVGPCLAACRAKKLKEVFFTMWGDNGGYCDYGSAFAGLAYAAELAFAGEAPDAVLERRVKALFGGSSYKAVTALGEAMHLRADRILLDDPLMLLFIRGLASARAFDPYGGAKTTLAEVRAAFEKARKAIAGAPDGDAGSMPYARALADALCRKADLAEKAFALAKKKNHRAGAVELLAAASGYAKSVSRFNAEFRRMWHSQNKPFGFESIQIRLAAQAARAGELVVRLGEFLRGKGKTVPELAELARVADAPWVGGSWPDFATASCIL